MGTDAQIPEHTSEQVESTLDPRKVSVLNAIVREYVQSAEPVGSKRIVDAYNLGVSAATVRNEMSALEESGYITQPHTSAGRVPTDKGYRYFVDALEVIRPVRTQRLVVQRFLEEASDLEDLLRRASQVLARLTHYASLVLAPAIDRSRLKLLELVQLSGQVAMVLLIADTGRVVKRIVELPPGSTEVDLQRARTVLNESAVGLRMADVPAAVAGLAEGAPPDLRGVLDEIASSVAVDLGTSTVDRVYVGGQAALAGEGSFETKDLRSVFELLEEEETIGRVLAESATLDRPLIRIGEENEPIRELRAASIVATGYGDDPPGSLGVLGPTRMDYPSVLAVVHAVAEHLRSTLGSLTEDPPDG